MALALQQQSRHCRVDTATQSHHDTLLLAHAVIICVSCFVDSKQHLLRQTPL
jgi:hypothetical protein